MADKIWVTFVVVLLLHGHRCRSSPITDTENALGEEDEKGQNERRYDIFPEDPDPETISEEDTQSDKQPSLDPETSSMDPETSSPDPETSSTNPETSSMDPEISSQDPETSSTDPETSSMDPETSSQDPETSSTDPETSSMDPETSSQDPETSSMDPETSSPDPETFSTSSPQFQNTTTVNTIFAPADPTVLTDLPEYTGTETSDPTDPDYSFPVDSGEDAFIPNQDDPFTSTYDNNPLIHKADDEVSSHAAELKRSYSFNPPSHDQSKDWAILSLNGLRLDLNNHIIENNNYFQQIIAKFDKLDEVITIIKKDIEDEKIRTTKRFTDTKAHIDKNDADSKEKQKQLTNSIKGNQNGINRSNSKHKQDREKDQKESKAMQAGINKQIATVQNSMRQQFDQLNNKLAQLERPLYSKIL